MISPRTNSATYLPNILGVFITSIPFDLAASMSIWSVPEPHLTIYFNFVAVFITKKNKILINHRKHDGLLGGLWELPITEISNNCSRIDAMKKYVKSKYGFSVNIINQFDNVKHSYSHYKLLVTLFMCELKHKRSEVGHWINIDEIDKYAFSKINHKLFDIIGVKNF